MRRSDKAKKGEIWRDGKRRGRGGGGISWWRGKALGVRSGFKEREGIWREGY